jgi:cyanate permease
VIRIASAALWLGVGLAKMAALVLLIDGDWRRSLLALVSAWAMAALALWLPRRHGRQHDPRRHPV